MPDPEIQDRTAASRFTATVDGETAELKYALEDGMLRLIHTGVPESVESQGVGSALARHALDVARERGLTVWPDCPFVAEWMKRHPDYLDLLDPAFPRRKELGAD